MPRIVSLMALPALLVAGCASVGGENAPAVDTNAAANGAGSPAVSSKAVPRAADGYSNLVYRILVGELAGRRGRTDLALEQYLALSRESPDPRLSERAVQIGFYSGQVKETLPAARRWAALAPDSQEAERTLAVVLIDAGEDEEVTELFLAWMDADADDSFAAVSSVMQRVDDNDLALRILAQLRTAHPDSGEIQQAYALRATRAGQLDQALEAVDRALAAQPGWNQALLLKSRILVRRGDSEAASALLEQAAKDQPDDTTIGLGYVRLLLNEDRIEDAREMLDDLAARRPNDADVLFAAGVLAAEAGHLEDAERYLRKSVDKGEARPDAYFELGRVAEQRGQTDQAVEWYERVRDGQRVLDAQVRIGNIYTASGQNDQANAHFEVLRRDNPQLAVRLYMAQAESLRDHDQTVAGVKLLDKALAEHPEDHDLLYTRALLSERLGRVDQLESDLRLILASDPDNAHALNALGYTLADRTDRFQEAHAFIKRALALMPDDAAILDSMGWVLYRLERYDEALVHLRRAYELSPDQEIAAHLGEVLWVSGERKQAMEVWNGELQRIDDAPQVKRTMRRFGI